MNVDANGIPFVWKGNLKKKGYNWLENVFSISNKILKMESKWSSKLNAGLIMWDNFRAGFDSKINILNDGYEEIGTVNYNGTLMTYHYKAKNTMNKTETCITGNVMSEKKFGHCLERYTGDVIKGYIVKIKTEEGTQFWNFLLPSLWTPDLIEGRSYMRYCECACVCVTISVTTPRTLWKMNTEYSRILTQSDFFEINCWCSRGQNGGLHANWYEHVIPFTCPVLSKIFLY